MTTAKNAARVAARRERLEFVFQRIAAAGMDGMKVAQAVQIDGSTPRTIEDYLQELCLSGRLKRAKEAGLWTYYGTEDAYKAARARITAREKARQAEWTLAKAALRRAETASKPKPAPKQQAKPKPKEHQKITIKPPKVTPAQAFTTAEADYSRAVITRIPTPPPRFAPEPGFRGQITADWRESRMREMAA